MSSRRQVNECFFMDNNIVGMLSFLSDSGNPDIKILFLAFVVFIIIAYKALNVLKNTIIISAISASFPFILNRFFGFDIVVTMDLILFYIVSGIFLYILYVIFNLFYKTSKLLLNIMTLLAFPFVLILNFLSWVFGFKDKKKKKNIKKKTDDEQSDKKK